MTDSEFKEEIKNGIVFLNPSGILMRDLPEESLYLNFMVIEHHKDKYIRLNREIELEKLGI